MTFITILLLISGVFGAGYVTAGIMTSNIREDSYMEGFEDGYHKAFDDLKEISREGNKYEVL